jgi:hypothetical protein
MPDDRFLASGLAMADVPGTRQRVTIQTVCLYLAFQALRPVIQFEIAFSTSEICSRSSRVDRFERRMVPGEPPYGSQK